MRTNGYRVPSECTTCGIAFIKRNATHQYCSKRCKPIPQVVVSCRTCGKEFVKPSRVLYCSNQCRVGIFGTANCAICGSEFTKVQPAHKYCSKECQMESLGSGQSGKRFTILNRDGFTCQYCGTSPRNNPGCVLHVDHVLPLSQGGSNDPDNLITACELCNLGKKDKFDTTEAIHYGEG